MMLYFWQKMIISINLNACTLSMTIFQGQPNLDRIFFCRKLITTESVSFLVGTTSTHLVK
jgi:hypothetical protein